VLLLRNNDLEYNNPLASFATCLCSRRQMSGHERTACVVALSMLGASRSRLCLALTGLAFIYPALPTCLVVYVQKLDFHLINMFCVVIVAKI